MTRSKRGIPVEAVGPWSGPDVDQEEPAEVEQPLVDGQHARVVREEALDVDVELEAVEAVAEKRLVHGLHQVRIVGVDRPQRNAVGHARADAVKPGVDLPRDPAFVGVGKIHEALDAAAPEEGRDQLRLGGRVEPPVGVLGEPPPDGAEEPLGVQVGVDVDVAEPVGRLHQGLTTQVPGQPATSTPSRTRPAFARRATARAVSDVPETEETRHAGQRRVHGAVDVARDQPVERRRACRARGPRRPARAASARADPSDTKSSARSAPPSSRSTGPAGAPPSPARTRASWPISSMKVSARRPRVYCGLSRKKLSMSRLAVVDMRPARYSDGVVARALAAAHERVEGREEIERDQNGAPLDELAVVAAPRAGSESLSSHVSPMPRRGESDGASAARSRPTTASQRQASPRENGRRWSTRRPCPRRRRPPAPIAPAVPAKMPKTPRPRAPRASARPSAAAYTNSTPRSVTRTPRSRRSSRCRGASPRTGSGRAGCRRARCP